ncbi:MAG: acyloxyacyl hydrolase [Alphaproteobacteria bacterium]|nr:MAG: acyloxyacyl hydrolase [Alphaproteobacteria bacterium]
MRFVRFAILAFVVLCVASAAYAAPMPRRENPDLVTFSAGEYDVFDDKKAAEFVLEYRVKSWNWNTMSPLVGIMATTDGAVYGFAGLGFDWFINKNWVVNPNFAAGAYHNGSGKDLGSAIEFRSGLELNYVMEDRARLGLAFNHISNASIGDENPGTESLLLTYSMPIGW